MPKEFTRAQRVGELVHHALAQYIQQELPYGPFGLITVSRVIMSPALDHAKVYITVLNEEKEHIDEALELLEENNKALRHMLAQNLKLRIAPHLRFYYDSSISRARKLNSLINEAIESDKKLKEGKDGESS